MKKVQDLLLSGEITLDDIEEYLNYIGRETVNSLYLSNLEDISANHPG